MAVEYKDYYKLLGVSKTASAEEISKAYKKLARKHHPDLNQNDKTAETKFKEINEAYEVLKDDEKRKLYDQLGPDWQHGQKFQNSGFGGGNFSFNGQNLAGSGFSDFFEVLFGGARGGTQGGFSGQSFGSQGFSGGQAFSGQGFGADPFGAYTNQGRQRNQRGQDIEATLNLNLEDAFNGGKKTVTFTGSNGEAKTLEINIPAGVKDGAKIRLVGQGEIGSGSGSKGDLYLKIQLEPHPLYKLDGLNIVYDLFLNPWEAVLGTKAVVPTLSGNIELNISPGSSSGKKLRIKAKGLGQGAEKGDMFVRIMIKAPENLNPKEKELWEKLAELAKK